LAPEGAPIESSPVTVLQVNQNGQNEEHYDAGQNTFSIHEKGKAPRRGPNHAKRETATQR
jgi:hypothetical protein